MRLGQKFIDNKKIFLSDNGFIADPGRPQIVEDKITWYHYTKEKHLEEIFNTGLYARRPVSCPTLPDEFTDCFLVEGFLDPVPTWVTNNLYFGNFGYELMEKYIGNILLKIEIPKEYKNIYVADYAHILECKYKNIRGNTVLDLGYDCSNGHEVTQAYVNSYVPLYRYENKHLAPVIQLLRKGEGIAISGEFISLSEIQPLKQKNY